GGSEGTMAVIDLFGPDTDNNEIADELETIIENKWLINEANLTFTIDDVAMKNAPFEPKRVYLYDLDNRRPLIDYTKDVTTISGSPKYNKYVHDGLLQKSETTKRGTKYRVRITNHIRNLVRNDSTNVRLGLVVTES